MARKNNPKLTALIARLATESNLTVAQWLRLKACQALAIEKLLGPQKWNEIILYLENERLGKEFEKRKLTKKKRS